MIDLKRLKNKCPELYSLMIRDIKQSKNKYPRLYDLAEKEYMEANEDVAINPHGHIIIEELTSYHALRFFQLLNLYID